jgi:hypothetical protein
MRWILAMALAAMMAGGARAEEKLEPIFNGKDLAGWDVPKENPWWSAADGVLIGVSDEKMKGSTLYTEKKFKDVIIETEVRFGDGIDSGIFVRQPELQVQIGVSRSLKVDMTCSIYISGIKGKKGGYLGKAEGVDKLLKLDEWNKIRIEAVGNKYTTFLNGQKVLVYESEDHPEAGPIGLQIHPGLKMKVEFRNLRAREVEGEKK